MRPRINKCLARALAISAASYTPIFQRVSRRRARIPNSHAYFLEVWQRHLAAANRAGVLPRTVVELGPGSLLACGIFALLGEARSYVAIDTVELTQEAQNLSFLARLPALLRTGNMTRILSSYGLSSEQLLERLLEPGVVNSLREALIEAFRGRPGRDAPIRVLSPAEALEEIEAGEVDLVFSHAVLEHVHALSEVLESCQRLIGTRGVMSHRVDLRCHSTHDAWNGHWTYSKRLWRVLEGRRPYLINREPAGSYRRILTPERGFEVLEFERSKAVNTLAREQLAREFKGLSEEDLSTCSLDLLVRSTR